MSRQDEAEQLARELFEANSKLRAAGRALHDEVGPLLTAAGIGLDLLRADHPQAAASLTEVIQTLDRTMERVRALSRELNPSSAAHLGLKKALETLAESIRANFKGAVQFTWASSIAPPADAAVAIYEAASAALGPAVADRTATQITISARGAPNLIVTISSNGKARLSAAALKALNRRLKPAKISLDTGTKKSTIVSIYYAARRPSSGRSQNHARRHQGNFGPV